jgi:uncharacterized protein (DUF1810 family)
MTNSDPHNLQRFLDAQDPVFERVLAELRAGQKHSHWMWFIFPQIRGLGHSETAQRFAIASRAEAESYLAHPILGGRLRQCTQLVVELEGRTVSQIFGYPDDLKFHSSMTLFESVSGQGSVFETALNRYFDGERDLSTLKKV